eukprot:TRINITY_DN37347_c0_g1_i1.p1 TRINITY_DN37347_c0_g1~~TRINITY_DN37347_c0_g1_i1.p1  ORF type:complete len:334 (+),score=30.51 TRINITY_DN37347_c0_g1_i1:21-1022(+)
MSRLFSLRTNLLLALTSICDAAVDVASSSSWCRNGKRNGALCCEHTCDTCGGPACTGQCCGLWVSKQDACASFDAVSCVIPAERIQARTAREVYVEKVSNMIKRLKTPPALTMQNWEDLLGLQKMLEYIVDHDVAGDIYETGCWRGGTGIFMVYVLRLYEQLRGKAHVDRHFWLFDSFSGFNGTNVGHPSLEAYLNKPLYNAPLEFVRHNFQKYGVLNDRVHFIKGLFEDTIPKFAVKRPIAILRLDGDLYSSTMVALKHFYDAITKRGWIVIDDYWWRPVGKMGEVKVCQEAVKEFRKARNITQKLGMKYAEPAWQIIRANPFPFARVDVRS